MTRSATAADVALIATIEAECFGTAAWSEQLVREHLEREHRSVLIRDDVAYGAISVLADVADLDRIAVLPSARRRGLARELLVGLIAEAREAGSARMLLEVAADNAAAIRLYESSRFTTISTRKGYYPGGVDALILELSIEESL